MSMRINNILRMTEARRKTGLSRSTIYNKINPKSPWHDPEFPSPRKLGSNAIGFIESELDDWIQSRLAIRQQTEPQG